MPTVLRAGMGRGLGRDGEGDDAEEGEEEGEYLESLEPVDEAPALVLEVALAAVGEGCLIGR